MSEAQLMDLAQAYGDLLDVAQAALREEFARRKLEPPLVEDEVSSEEEDLADDQFLVTVAAYRDMAEAFVARAMLEEAGIKCLLRDENTVRMDWLWSNAIGGMRLQVARKDEVPARQLLSQPIPERIATGELGDFEQPICPACNSRDVVLDDPDRKILAVSMLINFPIPHRKISEERWHCSICGRRWTEEDDPV